MFPPPEILGCSINWFELITVLAVLITLVFGRFYFARSSQHLSLSSILIPLAGILLVGYFSTYVMAYFEGQAYGHIKDNSSYFVPFGAHKKFLGFVSFLFLVVLINQFLVQSKKLFALNDYLAVVVCFFIILEANACLFDGHGCYGRFTNLPWGMLFIHGSAPTLLPVHPTPLYISISHLILFFILLYFRKRKWFKDQLILVLMIGTSLFNFLIEFFKDIDELLFSLNFAQLIYSGIGLTSLLLLLSNKQSRLTESH